MRFVVTTGVVFLRRDDDIHQFGPASTTREGPVCDGSGGGGDSHIHTAAAGVAATINTL